MNVSYFFVAIALNIKNHWSWRWWRLQVEFSVEQIYCFQCARIVKCAFLIRLLFHRHENACTFCPSNADYIRVRFISTHGRHRHPIHVLRIFAWIALLRVISIHISHAIPHHTAKLISNAFWFWKCTRWFVEQKFHRYERPTELSMYVLGVLHACRWSLQPAWKSSSFVVFSSITSFWLFFSRKHYHHRHLAVCAAFFIENIRLQPTTLDAIRCRGTW